MKNGMDLRKMKYDELNTVMNYLALKDQCDLEIPCYQGGYSRKFRTEIMPKIEELIHNDLTMGTELFDFWVEQTKKKE